jgi:GNAT superfamily N-acetyltransferase
MAQPLSPKITVTDAPGPDDVKVIADGLGNYNDGHAGYRDYKPIAVTVADPATGVVVGGLYGRTSYGQLFIERFFLPEAMRRDRLGGRLLGLAEEEARRRGCTRVALFTLSFQAPGFYKKLGYTEAAVIDPDPPGVTRHLMVKTLG